MKRLQPREPERMFGEFFPLSVVKSIRLERALASSLFAILVLAGVEGLSNDTEQLPSLDTILAEWKTENQNFRSCDLVVRRLRILPYFEIIDSKRVASVAPTHDEYSKAFLDYLKVVSPPESPDEGFFNRFCGSSFGQDHVFMNLRHFWIDSVFQSDGVSVNFQDRDPFLKFDMRVVRTEENDFDLKSKPQEERFPFQSQVFEGGKSQLWVPDLSIFTSKPIGLADELIRYFPSGVISEKLGGMIRYSSPNLLLDIDASDHRAIHWRYERNGRVRENWYFGRHDLNQCDGISIPKASFQLTSRTRAGDVARVGVGPGVSYIIKSANINSELPEDSFRIVVPAGTVVTTPKMNTGLTKADVDAVSFAKLVDDRSEALRRPASGVSRSSYFQAFVLFSSVFGFALAYWLFFRKVK